jgi:hypothetical protein
MTGGLELSHQFLLEFKSTVIGCKSYAHKKRLMTHLSKARGKQRPQMGMRRGVGTTGSSPRMYFGVHQMKA